MRTTDSLRIGDAERDAAIAALARHFADGRLTQAEHEERTSLALKAKTGADLRALFTDLPLLHDPPPPEPTPWAAWVVQPVLFGLLAMAGVMLALHMLPVVFFIATVFLASRVAFGGRRRSRAAIDHSWHNGVSRRGNPYGHW